MVHEYALDPAVVATWGSLKTWRFFSDKFGLGSPRIVSRYPKRWARLVWELFEGEGDLERKRMEEVLQQLTEKMIRRRNAQWDPNKTWLENAELEHERLPFDRILAGENPRCRDHVLVASEIEGDSPLWAHARSCVVRRGVEEMANAVSAMLRIAEVIVFVDPYFGPDKERHVRALGEFLRVAMAGRVRALRRVTYCASAEDDRSQEFYKKQCEADVGAVVPEGLELEIIRLASRDGGERLHNRYILTDIGGVVFGTGLDRGRGSDTDDVMLMGREQYERRWRQYVEDDGTFRRPFPSIKVVGRCEL